MCVSGDILSTLCSSPSTKINHPLKWPLHQITFGFLLPILFGCYTFYFPFSMPFSHFAKISLTTIFNESLMSGNLFLLFSSANPHSLELKKYEAEMSVFFLTA
jgi:hypothetical protein